MTKKFYIYAAIVVGTLAISLDFASVDLALPAMEHQFGLDLQSIQWVINGYVLAYSVLLVAGGRFADAYGRKLVFLIGMAIFAATSLLGGMAWSGGSVILFRVLQGVGAALLWPAMIGLACEVAGDANSGFALGLVFGTCSVGNAAGPVLGGFLTQWLSWRWVLWINVPMAVFSMLLTMWAMPRDRARGETPRNDYPGMVALTGGLVALMLVVYQAQAWGWRDIKTLGLAILAIVLLGVFPLIERRSREPLIPPDLMRNREFLTLCLCALVVCQLFFVVLLYFTQYAMKFLEENPTLAGARVVQFMLSYGLVSYFSGSISKRIGSRALLLVGLASAVVASLALGIFGPAAPWLIFNASLILLGIGVGSVITTLNSRAIESVGASRAGLVSGITFMVQLSGSAVMLAINTAIFLALASKRLNFLLSARGLTLSQTEHAKVERIMAGAKNLHLISVHYHKASELSPYAGMINQAYVHGLEIVLYLSALLAFAAFLLVLRCVSPRPNR